MGIRNLSKTRVHFLSEFTYPLQRSHALSGLSGWENKGVFGQAAPVTTIKGSRISEITKDFVFDLIHG